MDKKKPEHNGLQNNTEERVRSNLKKKLRKKRIKRIITYVVVLLIILGAVFLYQYYKTNGRLPFAGAQSAAALAAALPQTTTVREIQYTQTIDISGNVEAYETQEVMFRATGAVTGVFVEEGDSVTKGQLLATVDDTSQKYRISNIESQIEQAKLEGSPRQLELLELQLQVEQNSLDYTRAYANFDGVVATVSIDEGDYAEAGMIVMVIIDRSRLKAVVEIDEIDILSVSEGMTADLSFDSLPGETIIARVDYIPMIGRTTSQGIGVMDVKIVIDDPPPVIAPGFTFAGTIAAEEEKTILVVPTSAISTQRGVSTVQKKGTDGNPVTVVVTTKYLGEGMTEIVSGDVKAGDEVFVKTSSSSFFGVSIPQSPAMPSGPLGGGGR